MYFIKQLEGNVCRFERCLQGEDGVGIGSANLMTCAKEETQMSKTILMKKTKSSKRTMTGVVRGGFPEATNAEDDMKSTEEKSKESEKTETSNLMNSHNYEI